MSVTLWPYKSVTICDRFEQKREFPNKGCSVQINTLSFNYTIQVVEKVTFDIINVLALKWNSLLAFNSWYSWICYPMGFIWLAWSQYGDYHKSRIITLQHAIQSSVSQSGGSQLKNGSQVFSRVMQAKQWEGVNNKIQLTI